MSRSENRPTLYLMCGLPGSGKTTVAKRLEAALPALRLTPDEWMTSLFGIEINRREVAKEFVVLHDRVEQVMWPVAEQALNLGVNVILDFGVWARSERDEFRERAAKLGARSEIVFLEVPRDELKNRIQKRNREVGEAAYNISNAELDEWSALFQPPDEDELIPRE